MVPLAGPQGARSSGDVFERHGGIDRTIDAPAGDCRRGFASRADVADFLIKQIDGDTFLHKMSVLMN